MKVIISHDVDHISAFEHKADLILPKFIARAILEMLYGRIDARQFSARLVETVCGRWNFIRELSKFDSDLGIRSTFFFAVKQGIGLAYKPESARELLHATLSDGHCVGLHGIARRVPVDLERERYLFEQIYGVPCSGVRMHYLHYDYRLLLKLSDIGYSYDSTFRGNGSAAKHSNIWTFPIHIMDGDMMLKQSRYQTASKNEALQASKQRIRALRDIGVDYVSVLFHDRYFSPGHADWRDWYCDLVHWLIDENFEFCTYEEALIELKENNG